MMSNLRVLIVVHDAIYNAPDRSDPHHSRPVQSADRTRTISRRNPIYYGDHGTSDSSPE